MIFNDYEVLGSMQVGGAKYVERTGVGPKPEGNGWYRCGCCCHSSPAGTVHHVMACCQNGWKRWYVAGPLDPEQEE